MSWQKIIMDLERINVTNADGCPACGKQFSLGDSAVLACGPWGGGPKYIHEYEAVFDSKSSQYFEKGCYDSLRPK